MSDREETIVVPSGLTYRVVDNQLEVLWEGRWVPANSVDAEDAIVLMRWAAGGDL